jgi:hypothetical protein
MTSEREYVYAGLLGKQLEPRHILSEVKIHFTLPNRLVSVPIVINVAAQFHVPLRSRIRLI